MLKWTLNLSAFVLALPMLYIFGCGLLYTVLPEWMQFLILLVAVVWLLCVDLHGHFGCRCSRAF